MKKILLLSIVVSTFSISSLAQLPSSFKESRIKKYEIESSKIGSQLKIIDLNIKFLENYLKDETISSSEKEEINGELQKFLVTKKLLKKAKTEAENMSIAYRKLLYR